jgi:glycosyltransferase involved in cell wall biosynthesis
MDPVGQGWRKIAFFTERFFLRATVRAADVIRISSSGLANMSLLHGLSTCVIPFGITQPPHIFEKNWNESPIFLCVCRLATTHYFKGVPELLQAFAVLHAQGGHGQLHIVGDGDLRKSFELRAAELGIASNTKFLGSLSDEKLQEEYARAQVVVLPSTDTSETFGLVLLEALAQGTPIIASDLPGVASFFEGPIVGKKVPPGDITALTQALRSVCDDPAWWKHAAADAPNVARAQGDWTNIAKQLSVLLY